MLENREGRRVPSVTFKVRRGHEWIDLTTDAVFGGKTVVLFALPGAYTPTCSTSHVPRYNQLAPVFFAGGVDTIACLSVNDTYVMNKWQREEGADRLLFLPDGNGEFTAAMGMLVDKGDQGLGRRSWRYSMLVRDGLIEKMFIEEEVPGDPFAVSDADTMLAYIDANARKPPDVVVFTREGCPYSARAKELLTGRGIPYDELVFNRDYGYRALRGLGGGDSVPQVFISGEHIGGADALDAWLTRHPEV